MTTSALDIITGAARLIGVVFKSEVLDSDEANDGLKSLNEMLDSWSNDSLVINAYTTEGFSLTGAASYTIGTGGNFNTSRPINIIDAIVRLSNIDYALKIITPEEYQTEIVDKSVTTQIPRYLVYDNAYPLGNIKIYEVPTSGSTLVLQSNKPLSNLSALTTTVDLPPGWKRALKYNLAIDIAPEYGAEAIQTAQQILPQAKEALGNIKRATFMNKGMPLMPTLERHYNIYSDIG